MIWGTPILGALICVNFATNAQYELQFRKTHGMQAGKKQSSSGRTGRSTCRVCRENRPRRGQSTPVESRVPLCHLCSTFGRSGGHLIKDMAIHDHITVPAFSRQAIKGYTIQSCEETPTLHILSNYVQVANCPACSKPLGKRISIALGQRTWNE